MSEEPVREVMAGAALHLAGIRHLYGRTLAVDGLPELRTLT